MFQRIGLLLTVTVIMYYKVKWYPILYYHEVAFLLYILDRILASQKLSGLLNNAIGSILSLWF